MIHSGRGPPSVPSQTSVASAGGGRPGSNRKEDVVSEAGGDTRNLCLLFSRIMEGKMIIWAPIGYGPGKVSNKERPCLRVSLELVRICARAVSQQSQIVGVKHKLLADFHGVGRVSLDY